MRQSLFTGGEERRLVGMEQGRLVAWSKVCGVETGLGEKVGRHR